METLFAISIQQPWIDMILNGAKTLELRTMNVRRRGTIVLHAPWRIDFSAAYLFGYREPWKLPRGQVLAVAEIERVDLLEEEAFLDRLAEHRQPIPIGGGVFGIHLSNVRVLHTGVRCRGRQQLFPLPESVAERVAQALRDTPGPHELQLGL
jgi:hypothetical protein